MILLGIYGWLLLFFFFVGERVLFSFVGRGRFFWGLEDGKMFGHFGLDWEMMGKKQIWHQSIIGCEVLGSYFFH